MRNSHGEGRTQVVPRQETVDVVSASPRKLLYISFLLQTRKAYYITVNSCSPMLQLSYDSDTPVEERR